MNDQQGLVQAVLVARNQRVNLKGVRRWSKEGKEYEFEVFKEKLGYTLDFKKAGKIIYNLV